MKGSKEEKELEEMDGPTWLTKYERARIIGARAMQIALGAPPLIDVPKGLTDPIKIAELELEAGVLPMKIRRELLGRKVFKDVNELAKSRERRWKRLIELIK